jgi:hypothetical protein
MAYYTAIWAYINSFATLLSLLVKIKKPYCKDILWKTSSAVRLSFSLKDKARL